MTDYKKLRELCPELEKKETELRQQVPGMFVDVILDTMGALNSDALEAQPKLAEQQRRAFQAQDDALAKGDRPAANAAFTKAYDASKKAMDNLRGVCRPPSAPLVS